MEMTMMIVDWRFIIIIVIIIIIIFLFFFRFSAQGQV